jgi:hypothetical protein
MQEALRFDTTLLDQIRTKTIERAVLTYDETPWCPGCWTDGDGAREQKPEGCVDVRVPYGDWTVEPAPQWRGLLGTATDGGEIRRISAHEWDVTVPFDRQHGVGPGLGGERRVGFLLSGFPWTIHDLTADDNTWCMSLVSNIRLHVTYFVPRPSEFVQPN